MGLGSWFEHRSGFRKFMSAMLLEHIPGGARWRYVWGSCLSFVFLLQVVTGVLLMTSYSPSSQTAWSSVYYIQYQMDFGWLIRGLHHYGSQTMVVLLGLHMLQVVIAGAHLPPRELNWWLGLVLMGLTLGLSLTGYLLPWDQKGFWATQVATNIAGGMPLIGPWLQKIIIGGPEYGNATLTRFFSLHVAILPGLLILFLVAHIALFRRHGVTYPGYPKKTGQKDGWFWPEQVFRDLLISLIIFGVMLFLVLNGHSHALNQGTPPSGEEASLYQQWAKAGQKGYGANLDAPADPSRPYPARPEWYFLFLFQLLKYFEGDLILIGTLVIPALVGFVLFLLPLLGGSIFRRVGQAIGVIAVLCLLVGVGTLTCLAIADDMPNEVPHGLMTRIGLIILPAIGGLCLIHLFVTGVLKQGKTRKVVAGIGAITILAVLLCTGGLIYAAINNVIPTQIEDWVQQKIKEEERGTEESEKAFEEKLQNAAAFQKALEEANEEAARAVELASQGIPPQGSVYLLQRDPKSQFKPLFMKNCASCHSYGEFPLNEAPSFKTSEQDGFNDPKNPPKFYASDLAGFGTQDWIYRFLLDPGHERFYGRVKDHYGEPVFGTMSRYVKRWKRKHGKEYEKDAELISKWLASHPNGEEKWEDPDFNKAFKLYSEKYDCMGCHGYGKVPAYDAPSLTGYGSHDWLVKMISHPAHPSMYGTSNFGMPSFRSLSGVDSILMKEASRKLIENVINKSKGATQSTKQYLLTIGRNLDKNTEPQHGGVFVSWDPDYLVEWTRNKKKGQGIAYIFGKDGKTPAPIAAKTLLLKIDSPQEDSPVELELTALPEKNDPENQSSRFKVQGKILETSQDLDGKLSGKIGEKEYQGTLDESARYPRILSYAELSDINREMLIRFFVQDYRVVFGAGITRVKKKE